MAERDGGTNNVEHMLAELRDLQARQRNHPGGLSLEDWARLREVSGSLLDGLREICRPGERRQNLRVPISSTAQLRIAGEIKRVRCVEFSRGGVFLEVSPPFATSAKLALESITLDGETMLIGVFGIVAWRNQEQNSRPGSRPIGVGVRFVNLDEKARERVDTFFNRILDRASGGTTQAASDRYASGGILKFRSSLQVAQVCRSLLARVALDNLWNDGGPTDNAKEFLRKNGWMLSTGQWAMLLFVWQLWSGTCNINVLQLWDLPHETQDAIVRLLVAASEDGAAIDAWLGGKGPAVPAVTPG